MKYSDASHREEFLKQSGYGQLLKSTEMPGQHVFRYFFEKEDHTKSVFTLAKFIATMSDKSSATLVTLDNMFIWLSGRDEYLISTVFEAITEQQSSRPSDLGMLLWQHSEFDQAASLYHLALRFGWDAYIYPDSSDVSAFISHDGFIELRTDADPKRFGELIVSETTRSFVLLGA